MTTSDTPAVPDGPRTIAVSSGGDGFAFVAGRVLVRGDQARDRAAQLVPPGIRGDSTSLLFGGPEPVFRVQGVAEPLDVADLLSTEGLDAQPEHVFFAHACACCATPAWARPCGCDGGGWGLGANPLKANPLKANPLKANPLKANPLKANHPMESTARPAEARELPERPPLSGAPIVVVLDSGLSAGAGPGAATQAAAGARPPLFREDAVARRVTGTDDLPDTLPTAGDRSLDPVAGHGTFIAGLVEQLAPGCQIEVHRVLRPDGTVDEGDLCAVLEAEAALERGSIVSLSLGGQMAGSRESRLLRRALAKVRLSGAVVVASAGNDATDVPQFPAAARDVVAVAALDAYGPASFTNYGDWVDACAPGVDLVSAFFAEFDGQNPSVNGVDIDRFRGWARWSGTSFAAPVVVAALAREMASARVTAKDAVQRVVHAPHLLRLPGLGTVVNL